MASICLVLTLHAILQLSPDEGVQRTKKTRKLTPKEGRKKLVADYKELIEKHQQLREVLSFDL